MRHGAIVAERFEVQGEAGSGGMGAVFRAVDRLGGGAVALKVLLSRDEIDVERFEREAAVLASLRHPGIVAYVDHGTTADGERYLAMEWLEGEDLAARLARGGALRIAEGSALARRVAEALAFAHARGLVHRDIKPGNLLLVGGDVERVKILDFGIAQRGLETRQLTRTGTLLGTPGYLAPEQVDAPHVHDPRADVFALGCVLYECLAGRPAFEGERVMAVLAKILFQEAPRLRRARADVPEALDALVARMMARDPEARPRDGAEVAAELARLADLRGGASATGGSGVGATTLESVRVSQTSSPPSLTLDEQRVVSVVLAGDPDRGDASAADRPRIEELQAALDLYSGRIHALARGSLLVTLWGGGTAVERAERAARCALALRARFADLPIGVVTGRGRVSAREIEGEVIDRGVRALAGARRGAVTLDDSTAGMLGARFEIEPAGGAPLLLGERAADEGRPLLLGKATPYVGRSRELAMLECVFSGCVGEPAASAVLVLGAAGAGKSRLGRELLEKLRRGVEPVEILLGRGDSLGASPPFGMIADAIRRAAGVVAGEPLEGRRRKLVARLARCVEPSHLARVAFFLGEIAAIPFPDGGDDALRAARASPLLMSDGTRAAWEDWLAAECAARPVVLVLDDLQWGDAATVRLIDVTLRNLRELPLMVLVLARPEVHARFPGLWAERAVQTIKLAPLPRKACEAIVRGAFGPAVSDEVVTRVVDRADGNPFYLEELVRVVTSGRGGLPDSVLGTVEARLDAEGSEAKRVLRAASVFGDRFMGGGVVALLAGALRPHDVEGWLEVLSARELIQPASAPGRGDVRYVFQHALVREAAYATLTEADRALGHRLAGAWLESRGDAEAIALAEHFRRGGEPARAVGWYLRAAEQSIEASDLAAAVERAGRGVDCGAAGEELGALRLVEAEAHLWHGDLALAEQRSVEAMELLPPGSAAWLRASTQAAVSAGKLGRYDSVEARAQAVMGAPVAPADRSAELVFLCECASYLTFGGRYAAADAVLARLHGGAPDPAAFAPPVAALIYQLHAIRASYAGDLSACLAGFEAALASFEVAGDVRNACAVRSNLGFVLAELGDFEPAEAALRTAIAAAGRMGLVDLGAAALQNLGRVLLHRGQLDEARTIEERAADVFHGLGDPRMEGVSRVYLAEIALHAGDLEIAEREARAASAALAVAPPMRAVAAAMLARVLLRRGRPAEALPAAREAFAILEELGALEEGESRVRLVHAEALAAAGEAAAFARAIAFARDRLLARASRISDPARRERFLAAIPDNARTLALSS